MRMLQRYFLKELLKLFFLLLSALTVFLVFVGVFREIAASGLGPFQVLKILPYIVPSLLPFTIPATLLLAVCAVYGRSAGDHEITAAKAAGISLLSLLWPAFLLSIVMSLLSLVLTDQMIPWAISNIHRTVAMAVEDIFLEMLRTNHQVVDERQGFSITVMDVQGETLIKPTFQQIRKGRDPVTVQAATATIKFDLDNQQVLLHLVRGHIDIPGHRRVWFEEEDKPFPLPQKVVQTNPGHIPLQKLHHKMNGIKQRMVEMQEQQDADMGIAMLLGDFPMILEEEYSSYHAMKNYAQEDWNRCKTEVYNRLAMSLSCFFFVLIGGPFSIRQGHRQFLTSFFVCFLPILLVYYPISLLMITLCKHGQANPAFAMWTGNAILGVAGTVLLYKVMKH